MMTAVAATSVASFEAVGSIMVVSMLVAPGATAHLLTDRLSRMLWISALIAIASAILGYIGAAWLNTSVAGMIASVSLLIFIVALFLLITISSLASHEFSLKTTLISAVVLLVFSWLVFVKGLELQFPFLPTFLTNN
jgi:manganese/zinc/iron transport system permease protein